MPMWTRFRARVRHPAAWLPAVVLAAVGLLIVLLGPVAWWATPAKHLQGKDKADARNATRQVLLAAVGGLVLATGAAFAGRTFFLTRRGQLTDRYGKAITLLASDKLTERLGGIYALEHLMAESHRDHTTVIEVLAAFIRENTRDLPPEPANSVDGRSSPPPRTDVQAALTVLGRRPQRPETHIVDLSGADLRRADLVDLRFRHARLADTDLRGAKLDGVDLRGAALHRTRLEQASMTEARLEDAVLLAVKLDWADLTAARLHRATLGGVMLVGVDLSSAELDDAMVLRAQMHEAELHETRLVGVDLSEVAGLTREQLRDAVLDARTVLPPDLDGRDRTEPAE
jgi:uncharacterized protein YjbI with pentapeptide repeats